MADSGGHWKNLAEAQKLTQSMKIPGVFEEDIKRNNPLERISVAQAAHSGLKIEWLRESTTTEGAVNEIDIGDQLAWSDDIEYTEKEMTLRRVYIARKLDHYVSGIYGTFNNYEARILLECEKGLRRRLGARLIYADNTYISARQFDGYHALTAEKGTPNSASVVAYSDLNLDNETQGMQLSLLRRLTDAMKLGIDEILAPYEIIRRMDAAYQEKGFASFAYNSTFPLSLGFMSMGYNELGKRVLFWDGVPIVRTDYLVAEEDGTGTGASSNARALYTSTKGFSLFGVKYGDGSLDGSNPGIVFTYGGTEGAGDMYKLVRFPELEDYDAGGIRLVSYGAVILPSTLSLARIFDITDAAIVV